jgi:hypothetical protein
VITISRSPAGDTLVHGLLDRDRFVDLLIGLHADPDVREALDQAVAARKVIEGDQDSDETLRAKCALADAELKVEFELRRKVLRLSREDAIGLRQALTPRPGAAA